METSRDVVAGYRTQLGALRREEEVALAGLSEAQLNWRPGAETWSVGDVVAHLSTTNDSYLGAIERALAAARAKGLTDGGGAYRHGLLGGFLARSMEPPPGMKMKTPRLFRPAPALTRALAETVAEHRRTLDRLASVLEAAEGIDLRRARMASTVSPLLRMNVGDGLLVVLAHERRHLFQIRGLREHPGFPRERDHVLRVSPRQLNLPRRRRPPAGRGACGGGCPGTRG